MVLAHGLLGFAELRIAGGWLPAVHYWRGITNALTANGVEVITTAVPPVSTLCVDFLPLTHNRTRMCYTKL